MSNLFEYLFIYLFISLRVLGVFMNHVLSSVKSVSCGSSGVPDWFAQNAVRDEKVVDHSFRVLRVLWCLYILRFDVFEQLQAPIWFGTC